MSLFPHHQRLVNSKDSALQALFKGHQRSLAGSIDISKDDMNVFDDSSIINARSSLQLMLAPIKKPKCSPPLIGSSSKFQNRSLNKLMSRGKYDREPKSKDQLLSA